MRTDTPRQSGCRSRLRYLVLLLTVLAVGCGIGPPSYEPGDYPDGPGVLKLAEGEPQIERGQEWPFGDAAGNYFFSVPSKVILLDLSVDNHDISPETEAVIAAYLKENNLSHVKVRLNQYEPRQEWRRLVNNKEVGWFWRYTLGVLGWATYAAFPERIFAGFPLIGGGDHYNPYSNTINLYSDNPAIALHECGHAKDVASRVGWKGTYSALRILPVVPLYQEFVASDDAVDYIRTEETAQAERDAYKILYPAYATYIAGEASIFEWYSYPVYFGAVITGHIAGRARTLFVDDEDYEKLAPAPGD
jgi:hypothetical protein